MRFPKELPVLLLSAFALMFSMSFIPGCGHGGSEGTGRRSFVGQLLDIDGSPIADAVVSFTNEGGDVLAEAVTAADGTYATPETQDDSTTLILEVTPRGGNRISASFETESTGDSRARVTANVTIDSEAEQVTNVDVVTEVIPEPEDSGSSDSQPQATSTPEVPATPDETPAATATATPTSTPVQEDSGSGGSSGGGNNKSPSPSPAASASSSPAVDPSPDPSADPSPSSSPEPQCGPEDVDGDGDVDDDDVTIVNDAFGTSRGDGGYVAAADINNDDVINLSDLAAVLAAVGSC